MATLLSPHDLREPPEAAPLVPNGARVAFDRVSFSYPGESRIFDDFCVNIESGQRVGLVGPSGGGKSTFVALMQRFYRSTPVAS